MKPLFELCGLSCKRGSIQALDGVTIELAQGEFVALAGRNGAGKSTLLEIMAGLLHPYSGSCLFDGAEVRTLSRRQLSRGVSFLPQFVPMNLPFRAESIVFMGRFPHGDFWFASDADRQAVDEAMRQAGCADFRGRRFDQLSGGERQRVLLAAALAQQPRALLLDEPATFLDLPHQVQLYRTLRRLCRQGVLCVAATHDLNLAAAYCDRLIILDQGHVAIDATPSAAFADPCFKSIFGADVRAICTPSGRSFLMYGD